MKARELAEKLLQHPEYEVSASIDISTGEADAESRAFGDDVFEVLTEDGRSRLTILFDGYVNTPPVEDHTPAYQELLSGIFLQAIQTKALPLITGDITEGKLVWRGVWWYEEETSQYVRRAWLQQRETRISPVVEFDLSTGKYSLTE